MKNNLKSIFISHWVKHQRYDTELDSRTEWMKYVALATAEENLYELVPRVPKSNIIWHCHSCVMVSLHYLTRWLTLKHINCWWLKYKQTFSERFSWWTCLMPKCKLIFFSIFFRSKKQWNKQTNKQISFKWCFFGKIKLYVISAEYSTFHQL